MASFFEALEARCKAVDSLLCVGLDPHTTELGHAPSADAAAEFCLKLIEATSPVAAAYKPNAAFFEVFGAAGATALGRVIAAIPAGIPVLLDAKRGDIGTTAAAYASAAFDELKVRRSLCSVVNLRRCAAATSWLHSCRPCSALCFDSRSSPRSPCSCSLAGHGHHREPVHGRRLAGAIPEGSDQGRIRALQDLQPRLK